MNSKFLHLRKTGTVACAIALVSTELVAQDLEHVEQNIEELVVTSTLHRSRADTALPVNILAGEELREKIGATLGDTLQDQVGVSIASFGAGVGAPVIRGQTGNRVQILQGGTGNIDASSISADHANSLEPALAERIEVLRGPATLLYGNGAIGGVVNVIDNRIPVRLPDGLTGMIETRNNSVSDQQVSIFKLEGAAGQIAWHVDGVYRESNDVEIPGFAINPILVDLEDGEALEELHESYGKLANSHARSDVQTLGASWILEDGYIGFSQNQFSNQYGIPGGAHEHHDEEGSEEEVHDGEEEGDIRIIMEQQRSDLELVIPLNGWIEEIHGRVSSVDYQHLEIEGISDTSKGEVGTLFEQDGLEGRFSFHVDGHGDHETVIGLHFAHRNFSALGEEAFIPTTDIDSESLFAVHSADLGFMTYEFGARGETRKLDYRRGNCSNRETSWSGSSSAIWRLSENYNFITSIAHSQRSATVEELFSNIDIGCGELAEDTLIQHAATRRMEIGNPDVDKEKSTNFEIGLRKHMGAVTGEINIYRNNIADYIFLQDTGSYVDEVEIARYLQEDALFTGFEAEVNFPLYRTGDHLSEFTVFGDYVHAEFDRGLGSAKNVPRIPPMSAGFEWRHSHVNWQTKLRLTKVGSQSDLAANETGSDSYYNLNFYTDYHFDLRAGSGLVFLKATNLLDEDIRHHASLLKDLAPAAGRAIEVGLRLEF